MVSGLYVSNKYEFGTMLKKLRSLLGKQNRSVNNINEMFNILLDDTKSPKLNLGKLQATLNNQKEKINSIHEIEFKVFSQWGDDGIIQYLINKIDIVNKTFIEFGVENYKESNTRFLLINNNWSGYVIDGSKENIGYIKRDSISWAFDIRAKEAFITKENINELLSEFIRLGYDPEIGLLSIDIDGNDFWIWKEIDVINPIIVVTEYNAVFGKYNAWTIPYKADFYRHNESTSFQYWGASLKAFCKLAETKGYYFIGCNSNGNNAYFVRKDKISNLRKLGPEEGFTDSKFREYVDLNGERVGGNNRLKLIAGMNILDLESNEIKKIEVNV